MSEHLDNPYVGPRPFSAKERHLFFGREQEARDLRSLVISQRLVLFYAQSGAGKSSLINTRLLPDLEAEDGFITLPVGRVSGELPEGIVTVNNIYTFNLMQSLEQGSKFNESLTQIDLKTYLARLTTQDGEHYHYDPNAPSVSGLATENVPPHILVIDQFEEIITTHPDRWRDRAPFFMQLKEAMLADPQLWVLLTLREDYVAALSPYERLVPGHMRARYYMQRMKSEAARQAIEAPAVAGKRPFADGVAHTLLTNLQQIRTLSTEAGEQLGEFIEPVQLQVVCYQLWQNLKNRPLAPITEDDLAQLGDVDTALAQFYEQTIQQTLQEQTYSELELRNWFTKQLITEAETRGTVYQGETSTAGLPNGVVHSLARQYILRAEIRSGGTWYELVHDRFIAPILQANQQWVLNQSPVTQAALAWEQAGKPADLLLRDEQLVRALNTAQSQTAEPLVKSFLASSQKLQLQREEQEEARKVKANEDAKNARRFRLFTLGLLFVSILVIFLAIIAFNNSNQAQIQRDNAQFAEATAVVAQDQAEIAFGRAEIDARNALNAQATATFALGRAEIDAQNALNAQATAEALRFEAESQVRQLLAQSLAYQAIDTETGSGVIDLRRLLAIEAALINQDSRRDSTLYYQSLQNSINTPFLSNTLGNHTDWIISVVLSPDGNTILTVNDDNTARLWDLNGNSLASLEGHTNSVNSAIFSPDGNTILTVSDDNTARFWDSNGNPFAILEGHTGSVNSAAFSPDGNTILTVSDDNTARLWDLNGNSLATLEGHTGWVKTGIYSPDGRTILTTSGDNTARLWDSNGRRLVLIPADRVTSAGFSPNSDNILTTSYDSIARLWDLNGNLIATFNGHTDGVRSAIFSPTGNNVLTTSGDFTARLWDLNGSLLVTFNGHIGSVDSALFSSDGNTILTASLDSTARLWDLNGNPIATFDGHTDWIRTAAFSPDGGTILTTSGDNTARLWDINGNPIAIVDAQTDSVNSAIFSPDGNTVITTSDNSTARLWDLSGSLFPPLVGHTAPVWSVTLSPDGTIFASASSDATIRLWNLSNPAADPIIFSGHDASVNSVAFSPDGNSLASASSDATIRLWNLANPAADPIIFSGHDAS
ncbi:MAG: hypothetical protein AAF490_21875, partial [Chloroflexota bacterium]